MPRPLPPGGQRRRAVPLRLSAVEERPVRELADREHDGNLSEALRRIIREWGEQCDEIAHLRAEREAVQAMPGLGNY
ncbi:MAG: hypothetical protein AB7I38_18860 [Dehalococcoidia bacterium]